jgi:hypothetical protein
MQPVTLRRCRIQKAWQEHELNSTKLRAAPNATRKFIPVFTRVRFWSPILSQMNPVHTVPFYLHFNVMLTSTPKSHSFRFPYQNFVRTSLQCSVHHILFAFIILIIFMKVLIMQPCPSSCSFALRSKYPSQCPVLKHPQSILSS